MPLIEKAASNEIPERRRYSEKEERAGESVVHWDVGKDRGRYLTAVLHLPSLTSFHSFSSLISFSVEVLVKVAAFLA